MYLGRSIFTLLKTELKTHFDIELVGFYYINLLMETGCSVQTNIHSLSPLQSPLIYINLNSDQKHDSVLVYVKSEPFNSIILV